jgi:polyisoprenoid-binding protein YceI
MKKTILAMSVLALTAGLLSFTPVKKEGNALTVNTEKSRVDWVGTKKNDFHTGFFPIKSGSVTVEGGKLKGGKFVIDLANLKVTDAGGGDRLAGHLKSADFFDVAKNPEATYEITGVSYSDASTADITGNLSVKGLTVPVKLKANIRNADDKGFFAQSFLSIDKTLLGITYGTGNVANDVQLAIHLFAK